MISNISKKERDALKALVAGPVRRSAMPERVKAACDGAWREAGYIVKQEVGYGKYLYSARNDRLSKLLEVIGQAFPGYGDDAAPNVVRVLATQMHDGAAPTRQKEGVVMLRDFSGVLGGKNHLDDLQCFRLSTLESANLRTGLLVLTVESMESFLNVEPNKNGIPAFDVAIYVSGAPSERLLQWIGGLKYSSFTHYGNVDYQGMNIYQRVVNWCPKGACRLFKPAKLGEVFDRQDFLEKRVPQKEQERPQAGNPEIDRILEMIDRNGGVGVAQDVFTMDDLELEIVE